MVVCAQFSGTLEVDGYDGKRQHEKPCSTRRCALANQEDNVTGEVGCTRKHEQRQSGLGRV